MEASLAKLEMMRGRLGVQLSLHSLPQVVQDLKSKLEESDIGTSDLVTYIRRDAPLAARLIRSTNSPWNRVRNPILSIELAVAHLGLRDVRPFLLRSPVFSSNKALHSGNFDARELWRLDILCAQLCALLPTRLTVMRRFEVDELYAAGLLHDIGKHVLFESLGEEWVKLIERASNENRTLEELELETLGFTHADLGGMLAKRWQLGEQLVAATRFHHGEERVAWIEPIAAAIHFCDGLASFACAGKELPPPFLPEALRLLKVDPKELKPWLDLAVELATKLPPL